MRSWIALIWIFLIFYRCAPSSYNDPYRTLNMSRWLEKIWNSCKYLVKPKNSTTFDKIVRLCVAIFMQIMRSTTSPPKPILVCWVASCADVYCYRMKALRHILSWIYTAAVSIRHRLYDWGVCKSLSFDIPIVCVGNITVGGTGKTPTAEYLLGVLSDKYNIAILSRGYGRDTEGYREVTVGD